MNSAPYCGKRSLFHAFTILYNLFLRSLWKFPDTPKTMLNGYSPLQNVQIRQEPHHHNLSQVYVKLPEIRPCHIP